MRYGHLGRCGMLWHYANDTYLKPLFGKREKQPHERDTGGSVRMTVLQSMCSPPPRHGARKVSGHGPDEFQGVLTPKEPKLSLFANADTKTNAA